MSSLVCVDASLGLSLVLPENASNRARDLWQSWIENDVTVCAPTLYLYESISAIRGRVYRQLLTPEEGDLAFQTLLAQPVDVFSPPELYGRAWNLAKTLRQPKVYDSYYLALAELLDCKFWTADERLYNTVRETLPWARWIGGGADSS